jgi:hypothetical protein
MTTFKADGETIGVDLAVKLLRAFGILGLAAAQCYAVSDVLGINVPA